MASSSFCRVISTTYRSCHRFQYHRTSLVRYATATSTSTSTLTSTSTSIHNHDLYQNVAISEACATISGLLQSNRILHSWSYFDHMLSWGVFPEFKLCHQLMFFDGDHWHQDRLLALWRLMEKNEILIRSQDFLAVLQTLLYQQKADEVIRTLHHVMREVERKNPSYIGWKWNTAIANCELQAVILKGRQGINLADGKRVGIEHIEQDDREENVILNIDYAENVIDRMRACNVTITTETKSLLINAYIAQGLPKIAFQRIKSFKGNHSGIIDSCWHSLINACDVVDDPALATNILDHMNSFGSIHKELNLNLDQESITSLLHLAHRHKDTDLFNNAMLWWKQSKLPLSLTSWWLTIQHYIANGNRKMALKNLIVMVNISPRPPTWPESERYRNSIIAPGSLYNSDELKDILGPILLSREDINDAVSDIISIFEERKLKPLIANDEPNVHNVEELLENESSNFQQNGAFIMPAELVNTLLLLGAEIEGKGFANDLKKLLSKSGLYD